VRAVFLSNYVRLGNSVADEEVLRILPYLGLPNILFLCIMLAGRKNMGIYNLSKNDMVIENDDCPTVEGGDCTISFNTEYVLVSYKKKFFKKYLTIEDHEKLFKNIAESYWDKKFEQDQIDLLEDAIEVEKKSEKVLSDAEELSSDIGLIIDKF
tara:strand:- start:341 stop:802 length:462 start_codon:yes stop_codon:yes gene_type:complete